MSHSDPAIALILDAVAQVNRARSSAGDRLRNAETERLRAATGRLREALGILTARLVPPRPAGAGWQGAGVPRVGQEEDA